MSVEWHKTVGPRTARLGIDMGPQTHTVYLCPHNQILDTHDLVEFLQRFRPSSEWYVYKITNFAVFVYHFPDHPLGSPLKLPADILRNKGLVSFTRTSHGKRHRNSLCYLRYIFTITAAIYRRK